jgi:transcriptional regulator with XRE-family HTH domain
MVKDAPKRALRVYLAARGRTQQQVARQMRVSTSLITAILGGYRVPTPVFLRRFRKVTGIDLTQFPIDDEGFFTGKVPVPAAPVVGPELGPELVTVGGPPCE